MHIETVSVIHGKKSALPIRFLNILTATYCITETGYGSPVDNVAKRDTNHHMNKEGFGPAILDKTLN